MSSVPSTPFEKDVVDVLTTMMEVLETQHARFAHLEGHVAELSKRASQIIVKTPKNRKVAPFLLGAATGIYVYRTFVQSKVSVELKDKDGASWSFQKPKGEEKPTPPENEADPTPESFPNEDLIR